MKTLVIKLYFYSWNINGEQYNSALYTDERKRDIALETISSRSLFKGITFVPASIELFESDLSAIIKAFNR